MTNSVSATAKQSNRFTTAHSDSTTRAVESKKPPSPKAYARSPYRERTVMLRVAASLLPEFQQRLEQHKRAVAEGAHDNWE